MSTWDATHEATRRPDLDRDRVAVWSVLAILALTALCFALLHLVPA